MNSLLIAVISSVVLFAGGCYRTDVIPERLEGKADKVLRYADIKGNPHAYRGKLMLAGGKVLSAQRTLDGIQIEVLQIPLSEGLIPTGRDTELKGRFVIIDRSGQVSDPVIFDDGKKRITVVGEVLGSTTVAIDEVRQQVPRLALKQITVWGVGEWEQAKSGYWPYADYDYPYDWAYRGYYGGPFYW